MLEIHLLNLQASSRNTSPHKPRTHNPEPAMHALRTAILGPTPTTSPAPLDTQLHSAADVRQCLARGEYDEVRSGASNRTWIASMRYCQDGWSADSVVEFVHSLWDIYAQLARQADGHRQDALVLDVLRIQGLGPLYRPAGGKSVDVARTVDGALWSDLPFLVGDLRDVWVRDCATMSGSQRENFAGFLAKLASARICKDRMASVGLLTLRFALEDPRRNLRSTEGDDGEDETRSIESLDIAHLLPVACVWIKEAVHQLVMLSDVHWNDCPSDVGQGGVLFLESELGLGTRSSTGFSPWRFMFWIKRLHEIRKEAHDAGEKDLKEYATDVIERMVDTVQTRNSEVLRAYKSGGEALLKDEHLTCLLKYDLREHYPYDEVEKEGKDDTEV